jgi:hypothetical protein
MSLAQHNGLCGADATIVQGARQQYASSASVRKPTQIVAIADPAGDMLSALG